MTRQDAVDRSAAAQNITPIGIERAATLDVAQVAAELGVIPERGLAPAEAARRLAHEGPNAIPRRHSHALGILWNQFKSPLLLLLLGAAGLSAVLGDPTDAVIIAAIVVVSAGLGFYNESRAARIAESLRDRIRHSAVVHRGGESAVVDVTELVPGDLVSVKLGDVVPADLRLLQVSELECDESVLTGEGMPVFKSTEPVAPGVAIADLRSCALAGTVVSGGSGRAIVVATGGQTKFGAIAAGLGTRAVETEFQKGLRRFSMFLVYVGGALTAAIFAINIFLQKPILDALLFSLAIAVGITPQLLPAVVSTSLAAGSARMARAKVLVKRLVCIEDLGDISLVFTDKTGTLTRGRLDFARAIPVPGVDEATLVGLGLIATEAEAGTSGTAVGGNPLDQALWDSPAAPAATATTAGWTRLGVLPFDHERRLVSVTVQRPDGTRILVCKGAPESVLERCGQVPAELRTRLEDEFAHGSRCVAVATRQMPAGAGPSTADEFELDLAGLLVFLDPPKLDAQAALERLAALGIAVKIVTGDNATVALKVCQDLGLPAGRAITGPDIAAMTDDDLADAIGRTTVFARVSPEDKARIVKVGRKLVGGVAFLGDGVNDALALHSADIGISVDTATDVAKDAADVILLEQSLDVLADGVVQGRRIFTNTIKYVMMGTSSNFGNMFSAAGASIFLPFLPMLPSQILLNNLLYDAGQLAIPTDRVDEEQLRKPSHWNMAFIRRFMLIFGPISSVFDFATFAILLFVFRAGESEFQTGWFVESLATQAVVIFAIRTRRIPFFRSRPGLAITLTTIAVVAAGALIPLTPLGPIMRFTHLPPVYYLVIAGLVVLYLGLVELGKLLFYRTLPTGPELAQQPAKPRSGVHHLRRRVLWFGHSEVR